MSAPTLCMIFEAIGNYSAIAKVAFGEVQLALNAGWKVTVVAKQLDESLQGQVEWLPLYVPPRGFLLKWVTARSFIKRALGDRTFDVIHAHQPQAASLADVFQCHFLTRVAFERKCLESRRGLRPALIRLQQQGVLYAEDYFYRRWNPNTIMLYDSELTRIDFHRLYGELPREDVQLYPCPPMSIASQEERIAARKLLVGEAFSGVVLGYLGGIQERKGYRRLLPALEGAKDIFLLIGGLYSEGFQTKMLSNHCNGIGVVKNTDQFYAACDAFIVPSLFEPFGMVAYEAAVRGVPVIATEEVGALPHLLEYGAAVCWKPSEPLPELVRSAVAARETFRAGAQQMSIGLSEEKQSAWLLSLYDSIRRQGKTGNH